MSKLIKKFLSFIVSITNMIGNESKLWEILRENAVNNIALMKGEGNDTLEMKRVRHKGKNLMGFPDFDQFNINLGRSMIFYPDIISDSGGSVKSIFKKYVLCDNFLGLLINTLDCFLISLFKRESRYYMVKDVDKDNFEHFLKIFGLRIKYRQHSISVGDLNFPISDLLPKHLNLQPSDNVKTAFKLIDIELAQFDNALWERIFSNPENSYLQERHKIIHQPMPTISITDLNGRIELIENAVIDISKFVEFIMDDLLNKKMKIERERREKSYFKS